MESKVLATVAGVNITDKDIEAVIMRYPEDRRAYLDNEQGRKQVLEQLVSFELFNKFGKEIGLDKTEEYAETVKALEKEILTQIAITKVMNEITVTDEEALKYYEENVNKFKTDATISAKHILVDSEELAKTLKADIKSGKMTFEEAAMKHSSCPSKEQGGSLGVFGRGMMVPEFEEVAFNLNIGEVSEVVKTQFGYHLVLVDAKNDEVVKSFEESKENVVNQLMQERQQRKYLDMVKELEAKYGVIRN